MKRLNQSLKDESSKAYPRLKGLELTIGNFQQRRNRRCGQGYTPEPKLDPIRRCTDQFDLINKDGDIFLQHQDREYNPEGFCLFFEDENELQAEICRKEPGTKFQ